MYVNIEYVCMCASVFVYQYVCVSVCLCDGNDDAGRVIMRV